MKRRIASLIAASLLASCGGGGGGAMSVAPSAPSKPSQNKSVKISLVIPTAASQERRAHYVSPSAQGAAISVTGAQGGSGSGVVDLSSGSSACAGSGAQRTCSATVVVPLDNDTFTVTLYDAAPAAGAIPAGAHVLGVGKVTQQIGATFTGSVAIVVGATISNIGLSGTYVSVASGSANAVGIAFSPTDFGNNALSGSTAPYSNPITATLTESGGSGHMHLMLNGAPSGTSAVLTLPSDTVSVQYDGSGSAGYSSNVVLSATGATPQAMTVTPMYLSSVSTFFAAGTLALNGSATIITMAVTEANAPAAITYSATATGCSTIASLGAVSGSGASGAFNVAGGSTPSASGCTIAVSDSTGTNLSFHVINSPVGGTIPLPGESIQEYTIVTNPSNPPASPQAIVEGPDGRIWGGDVLNGGLFSITTSGVVTQHANGNYYYPGSLAVGSDGYIWAANAANSTLDIYDTASGSRINFYSTLYPPHYAAAGADGNVWFTTNAGGSGSVGYYTAAGVSFEFPIQAPSYVVASPSPQGIAASAVAGSAWFCADVNAGQAQIISVTSTGTMTHVVTTPALTHDCTTIVFQPDGKAAWVTSINSPEVYRIDTTTLALTTITLTGNPVQIVSGADNAMYVTESGSGLVGRISLAAPYTLNEIAAPNGSPTGIALGADGRMWYGENGSNKMGALTP